MIAEKVCFEEKQYLGYNKFSILRRLVLSLFCFVGYYWSQNPKPVTVSGIRIGAYPAEHLPNSGELFFLLGITILILSVLLIFVLHLHTQVTEKTVILIGLWTKRMVRIDLKDVQRVEVVRYRKLFLKQPVYNLHYKGKVRFYSFGNEAVELITTSGQIFRIGSQKAGELARLIDSLRT